MGMAALVFIDQPVEMIFSTYKNEVKLIYRDHSHWNKDMYCLASTYITGQVYFCRKALYNQVWFNKFHPWQELSKANNSKNITLIHVYTTLITGLTMSV